MGRIQSSIGLITGTDIVGTVDQLIAISARPRDRLLARTERLQREQQAIAELTASVIGVQLAGNQLANESVFRAKKVESSGSDALSVEADSASVPGSYLVRTLRTAATHSIGSLQRFAATDQPLGYVGAMSIQPDGGFIDGSATLAALNGGRGVEAGVIRITDRAGRFAEIDLSEARDVNDIIERINGSAIDVRATTSGNAFRLIDESGSTLSNLKVEQVGLGETAADLGLWGIDLAGSVATGAVIELSPGTTSLRGVELAELNGGSGIGPLSTVEITLSDGGSASVDLSSATTTSELVDAIAASGLPLIVGLNDARNGLRIRDVSGGSGTVSISSSDSTAAAIGLETETTDDILVGKSLNRQSVTADTLLSSLNQGNGINGGSFTIRDSAGEVGAVNLAVQGIKTVGELVDAINHLAIGVTAQWNDFGDGIALIDTAAGGSTLSIEDTGTGTAAKSLGIAGAATSQTVSGSLVSALVGSQAGIINVEATDTLDTLAAKINELGRYGEASVQSNEDGTYSLRIRSLKGGEAGRIGINTTGFNLDLRTDARGRDALIAVSRDGGIERLFTSADGVFQMDGSTGSAPGELSSAAEAESGLVLTLKQLSETPITITVQEDPEAVVSAAKAFVDQYNLLIEKLDSLDFYDPVTEEVGLLFGSSEVLRIRSGYSRLLSGRIVGAGELRSVGQVGLRFKDDGTIELDEDKLARTLASSRTNVEEFFTSDEAGLADRLSRLADRIAGVDNGMLLNRGQTLSSQIDFNNTRIDTLNTRLETERERLLRQFYATEEAIAKIQSNQAAISQIRSVSIPTE